MSSGCGLSCFVGVALEVVGRVGEGEGVCYCGEGKEGEDDEGCEEGVWFHIR